MTFHQDLQTSKPGQLPVLLTLLGLYYLGSESRDGGGGDTDAAAYAPATFKSSPPSRETRGLVTTERWYNGTHRGVVKPTK